MRTLNEELGYAPLHMGDQGDWLIAYTKHRDSDAVERSNYDALHTKLLERSMELGYPNADEDYLRVSTMRSWANGWIEHLIINPKSTELVRLANEQLTRLESYPILDDDLYAEYEQGDE